MPLRITSHDHKQTKPYILSCGIISSHQHCLMSAIYLWYPFHTHSLHENASLTRSLYFCSSSSPPINACNSTTMPRPNQTRPPLLTLEEVHVGEFLHLFYIRRLDDFLVVEEDPLRSTLSGEEFADEGYVVTVLH